MGNRKDTNCNGELNETDIAGLPTFFCLDNSGHKTVEANTNLTNRENSLRKSVGTPPRTSSVVVPENHKNALSTSEGCVPTVLGHFG